MSEPWDEVAEGEARWCRHEFPRGVERIEAEAVRAALDELERAVLAMGFETLVFRDVPRQTYVPQEAVLRLIHEARERA